LALLALSALSAGAYVYTTATRPPALDRSSLCPADGPRSISVALLDSTDDIPEIAKREVKTSLVDMAETLPTYGLLELRRSIADSQAVLVGQVQAIHAEFERAFASYREIDELVEEKTVAKSDAKAA